MNHEPKGKTEEIRRLYEGRKEVASEKSRLFKQLAQADRRRIFNALPGRIPNKYDEYYTKSEELAAIDEKIHRINHPEKYNGQHQNTHNPPH